MDIMTNLPLNFHPFIHKLVQPYTSSEKFVHWMMVSAEIHNWLKLEQKVLVEWYPLSKAWEWLK